MTVDPFAPRPIDLPTRVPLEPDADLSVLDEAKILAAPENPRDRPAWRAALHRWRDEARARTSYDGSGYDDPDTAWAATAWNVAMVWLWDEALRDWEDERFDVDGLLAAYDDVGGLDAVVLWHAYPVIGIDDRNQFDWYAVPGLRELVADLHAREVKVFLDYNPWDGGTRRDGAGRTDAARLADLLVELGADGLFLDTLKEGDPELLATMTGLVPARCSRASRGCRWRGSRTTRRRGRSGSRTARCPACCGRAGSSSATRCTTPAAGTATTPPSSARPGSTAPACWCGTSCSVSASTGGPSTGRLLRAMREVYRAYADHFVHGEWEPLTDLSPRATAAGVAGSRWSLDGVDLYTLANPTDTAYDGPLVDGAHVVLGDGTVPAGGIAGLVRGEPPRVRQPVTGAAEPTRPFAPHRVPPWPVAGTAAPGAVVVAAGEHDLPVRWRQRETGLYEAAPYADDWKPLPPRLHQVREDVRRVRLGAVAVDAAEVSNDEFAAFLAASGYRPRAPHRFLDHWEGGHPRAGHRRAAGDVRRPR